VSTVQHQPGRGTGGEVRRLERFFRIFAATKRRSSALRIER
jgi:hypothetical protein